MPVNSGSVASHFNLPDHSIEDLEVLGFEKIHDNDPGRQKMRESYWSFELQSLTPQGLNLDK